METDIVVYTSSPVPYLAKFWFSSYGQEMLSTYQLQDSLKCLKKEVNEELSFWHAD